MRHQEKIEMCKRGDLFEEMCVSEGAEVESIVKSLCHVRDSVAHPSLVDLVVVDAGARVKEPGRVV